MIAQSYLLALQYRGNCRERSLIRFYQLEFQESTMILFDDIDWEHERQTQRLHWARVLIDFASHFSNSSWPHSALLLSQSDGSLTIDRPRNFSRLC
jgi:hypothetical protein